MRTFLFWLLCMPALLACAQGSYPAGSGLVLHYSNGAAPCVPSTPIAPTGIADDEANTLSAGHALGGSEILMKIGSAYFVQYTGTISVANADLPAGYYQFKTKSATCRNESPVWQSPAFTASGSIVYNQKLLNYFAAMGLTNDAAVLYSGTPQQKTVLQLKNILNPMFISFDSAGLFSGANKFDYFYPGFGETAKAISTNVIDTGARRLSFPYGFVPSPFGIQVDGASQYVETGIIPREDLYGTTDGAMPSSGAQGYLAAYTNGAAFSFEAAQNAIANYSLKANNSGIQFNAWGNASSFSSSTGYTQFGFIEGNRTANDAAGIYRNGSTAVISSTNVTSGYLPPPGYTFKINPGINAPFCFLILSHKGFSSAQRLLIETKVATAVAALVRTDAPYVYQPSPAFYAEYPLLHTIDVTAATGKDNLSDYEYQVNGGAWATLVDSIAETYFFPGQGRHLRVFAGNTQQAPGSVKIRTKAGSGLSASGAAVNTVTYAYDVAFERYKPGYIFQGAAGIHANYIDWAKAVGTTQFNDFEYTTDGGATAKPVGAIPMWLTNAAIPAGNLGVRAVNRSTGAPRSGWAFASFAVDSISEVAYTLPTPKEFNASVTGNGVEGSSMIRINSLAYGFAVNDYLTVSNSTAPGGGRRGTRGTDGEWPHFRAFDSAYLVSHASDYTDGQYVWTTSDSIVRRKSGTSTFSPYSIGSPDFNFSQPIAARRKIVAIDSGGYRLTLDAPLKLTVNGTAIYPDNSAIFQSIQSLPDFAKVNVTPGNYPVARQIFISGKKGQQYNFNGVTLYSPAGTESASFLFDGCYGGRINPTGSGWFTVKGNYKYQGMGFHVAEDRTTYQGQDQGHATLPTLAQPMVNANYTTQQGICISSKGFRARNLDVWDAIYYHIQVYGGEDVQITGAKARHTEIIQLLASGNIAYYGGYVWAIHATDSKNVTFDFLGDTCFTSPKFINAMEAFNSNFTTFKNGIVRNGHAAFNGSSSCVSQNMKFYIDSNSRVFQNSGHPLWENNNLVNFSGNVTKNRFDHVSFAIAGPIDAAIPNSYPVGILVRDNSSQQVGSAQYGDAGVILRSISYARPNFSNSLSAWYGAAVKAPAIGADIDSVTATGNFGSAYLDAYGINEAAGASFALSYTGAIAVKNINVPTATIPVGNPILNVTTTERGLAEPPLVACEDSKTISTTSTTITATSIQAGSGKSIIQKYWSCVYASLDDRTAATSGLANPNNNTATSTGLQHGGVYVFKLTVQDNTGVYGGGFVQITVQ